MSADLRQKLEALADRLEQSMDHVTGPISEWQQGFDFARTDTVKRLRDLLASHEEREGEDGLVASLKRHLEDLEYEATGPRYGPATNGFAYAKIPDWLLRQVIDRLRSHTDRDAACPHFSATGAEVVRLYRCDGCGEVQDGYVDDRVTDPLGSTPDAPHFVALSGPPVQPEEET